MFFVFLTSICIAFAVGLTLVLKGKMLYGTIAISVAAILAIVTIIKYRYRKKNRKKGDCDCDIPYFPDCDCGSRHHGSHFDCTPDCDCSPS